MISKSNIESAIILAKKLRAKNKTIFVRNGTLLSLLQNETQEVITGLKVRHDELDTGNYGPLTDQISFLLNHKEVDGQPIPSDHDNVIHSIVPVLTNYINSNVDFTKRIVLPTLKRVVDHVTESIASNVSGVSEDTFFRLRPVEMPEFGKGHHLDFLKAELESVKDATVLPELNYESLMYGDEHNADNIMAGHDQGYQFFQPMGNDEQGLSNLMRDYIKDQGYDGIQRTYNQLVLLSGLRANPYWDSKVSTKENLAWVNYHYREKLTSLISILTLIGNEMQRGRIVSALTPGYETLTIRVMSGIDSTLPTLFVYENELASLVGKDNMMKFILGYMLSNKFIGVLETLTYDKEMTDIYIQNWETNKDTILITEHEQINNNILSAVFQAHVAIVIEEDLILQTQASFNRVFNDTESLRLLLEDMGTDLSSGDVFNICLNYIALIFDYSDAIEYIRCMDQYLNDPNTLNPTHTSAYIHAVQSLLIKFMSEQMFISSDKE